MRSGRVNFIVMSLDNETSRLPDGRTLERRPA
jgi:hypothetical protein